MRAKAPETTSRLPLYGTSAIAMSIALVMIMAPSVASAQADLATGDKKQTQLEDFEKKKIERKTLEEEEGGGGPIERDTNVRQWERDKLQYQDKAIRLMERRIESADPADPDYPLLLERLSEMYWQKAQYHDLRAFDRLQESREAEDAGNAKLAAEKKAAHDEDLETALQYREKTIEVYAQIISDYPLYENADKVLFYLAFNLGEMGRLEDANEFYKRLVREYPDTEYLADAYLGLAEYSFLVDEDMDKALEEYDLVIQAAPDTQASGYAMYKKGWAYFNLGEPKKALAQFERVIKYSSGKEGRAQLRREARKELVKAYSLWEDGKASRAKRYLSKFADDDEDLRAMMERLARLYQEGGLIDKSNYVYNQLIKDYSNDFAIVGWQIEIMLNVETRNVPDDTATEIKRTNQLFNAALELVEQGKMEGHTKEQEKEYYQLLEEYTRETAKWYHLTAQTTKNPLYYALAYEIYKTYVDHFPEASDNYEMMYYYAELLYWKKNWPEAAKRYDQVLDLDENGKYSQDAAYGAVLSYNKTTETETEECPKIPVAPEGEFPRYEIPQCRLDLVKAADRFVKIVPQDSEPGQHYVDVKYTAARVYYDYNQFPEAIERFEDIATNHSSSRLAIISANLMLDSFKIQEDYEKMWEWVLKFKENPDLYRGQLAETLDALEIKLAFKFCHDTEDEKKWVEAATCYEEYATNYPDAQFAPKALWSASVDWENASEIGKAIEARIRLLREHGDHEDLAPRALYAIGENYHGIAVYSEAARFYELFVDKYPKNKTACVGMEEESEVRCSKFALQNAAAFRGGLGQYEQAVRDYDLYTEMFPGDEEHIAELKFNTGRIYFDQGEYEKAIERYEEFLSRYGRKGPPSRRVAAYTAIGRSYWRMNRRRSALKYFEEAEEEFNGRKVQGWLEEAEEKQKRQALEAAAEARFMQGEAKFREAMAIELHDDDIRPSKMEKHLQKQLKKKAGVMQEAEPIYAEVIKRFNSPKWGLAALARLGMMYHDVASQIQNAPCPPRLTEDQCLYYEDALIEFGGRFEKKAIGFYVTAVEEAANLGWFSDYTALAQRRLFDLRPDEYRSASEIKAQPDQALVSWHLRGLYDDIEAAAGKKQKKKRGPIDLDESEIKNVKGEQSEAEVEETSEVQ